MINQKVSLKNINGLLTDYDFDTVVNLMDDDLTESLHYEDLTPQEFVNKYCQLHFDKYGACFIVN